jgi:hypothetical protein
MKNYLFAPFKDDDDKMETWNSCKSGIDQGIMVFLGRLESTYDAIIQDMHNNKAEIVDGLLEESNLLKAELQAVNDKDGLYDEVKELQAENDRLVEQVSTNSGNSSSTHTISKEVRDYMSHHPEHKEVRLFILPIEEFSDGDYNHNVYWDDGVEA